MVLKRYIKNVGLLGVTSISCCSVLVSCSSSQVSPGQWIQSTFEVETDYDKYKTEVWAVSDGGSWTDGSFNQQTAQAVYDFTGSNDQKLDPLTSSTVDISTAIVNAIDNGAKVIVCSGYLHNEALNELSVIYPEIGFIFVDDILLVDKDGEEVQQGNVASWMYDMKQSSFIAGYYAADYAITYPGDDDKAIVSTFGGMDIPSVTDFMIGFQEGVEYWNHVNGASSGEVSFYEDQSPFIGNFDPDKDGAVSSKTDALIKGGVDVILPVGGPQALTVINKVQKEYSSTDVMVIGVDTKLSENPDLHDKGGSHILGSITKDIKNSILSTLHAIYSYDDASVNIDKKLFTEGGTKTFGKVYNGNMANGYTGYFDKDADEYIDSSNESSIDLVYYANKWSYPEEYAYY